MMKRGAIKLAVLNYVAEHSDANYSQIAQSTGARPDYVRSVLSKHKIRLQGHGRGISGPSFVCLDLTPEMRAAFLAAARKRGVTIHEVVAQANQKMAEDGIIDAVLDDEAA